MVDFYDIETGKLVYSVDLDCSDNLTSQQKRELALQILIENDENIKGIK